MVKGHERKAYQPSSSAKAAQLVANTGPKAGSFGFGGFSGATPVTELTSGSSTNKASSSADAPALTGELDSEITQLLKSLTKKDATTKLKALQKLKTIVADKEPSAVSACLPAWAYVYNKLIMDNSRAARTEASAVLGAMVAVVGKGLAPFLKPLAGSWWLAQFDLHAEAAAAARNAFQAAFQGPKQKDALLFTRTEVLQLLHDNLSASPEGLGDARKESPEELAERHERVLAASLFALSSLLDLLVSTQPLTAANEKDAQSEVIGKLDLLLSTQGFLKKMLTFKSEHVRTAAYTLVAHICYRAPPLLGKGMQGTAALVLGAFQEQQAAAHGAMWEMVLAFVKAHPTAWQSVDMRKAVLPRLLTFLRQGCFGSGASSYPALLPLFHLLPKGLLGPDPRSLNDLLQALWSGLIGQMPGKARDAGGEAFSECLTWVLTQAGKLTQDEEGAQAYAQAVLEDCFCAQVVPSALKGSAIAAATAAAVIAKAVARISSLQGAASWLPSKSLQQLGCAAMAVLTHLISDPSPPAAPAGTSVSPFTRFSSLLDSLQPVADQKLLVQHVAGPVSGALVGPVQQGSVPAEAASLLASIVKRFGPEAVGQAPAAVLPGGGRMTGSADTPGLSLPAVLQSSLAGPLEGPAAQANADLILSCIHGKEGSAVHLAQTLHQLVNTPSPDPSQDQGAAPDTASYLAEVTGKTGRDNGHDAEEEQSSAKEQGRKSLSPGPALAVLLVQQLLQSTAQAASELLQWQSAELDVLASQLATATVTNDSSETSPEAEQPAALEAAALADVAQEVANAALDSDDAEDESEDSEEASSDDGYDVTDEEEAQLGFPGLPQGFPGMPQGIPGLPEGFPEGPFEGSPQGLPPGFPFTSNLRNFIRPPPESPDPAAEEVEAIADASEHPSAQLLGLLVKGRDGISLLSDAAAQEVFTQLAQTLQACLKRPSEGAKAEHALVALEGCLYSHAVNAMPSLQKLQHQIIALTFQLSWPVSRTIKAARSYAWLAAEGYDTPAGWMPKGSAHASGNKEGTGAHETGSDSDSEEEFDPLYLQAGLKPSATIAAASSPFFPLPFLPQSKPAKGPTPPSPAERRAGLLWAGGGQAADLLADASPDDHAALQGALLQVVLPGLDCLFSLKSQEGSFSSGPPTHPVYGSQWDKHWAALTLEVLTAINSLSNPQPLLDELLPGSDPNESMSNRGCFAGGLCFALGFDTVLFNGTAPRLSATRDMYLTGKHRSELQNYLLQHVCRDGSIQCIPALATDAIPGLLQQLLCALTAPLATSSPDHNKLVGSGPRGALGHQCLIPLSQLVNDIRKADFPNKSSVMSQWFRSSVLKARSAIPREALTEVLISATGALRSSPELVTSSGLDTLTDQLCQQASSLPPIAATDSSDSYEACTTALNDVFNLFHMGKAHSGTFLPRKLERAQGAATASEKKALLALAMKQVQGEVSVARAAAASRRAAGAADSPEDALMSHANEDASKACAGRLLLCAVIYCHDIMSEQDWRLILDRTQAVVSRMAVLFEDKTEAVAAAAVAAVGPALSGGTQATPQLAMELLARLSQNGWIGKSRAVQATASEGMTAVFDHDNSNFEDESLGREHTLSANFTTCFEIVRFLLAARKPDQAQPFDAAPSSIRSEFQQQCYADVLRSQASGTRQRRMMYASGAMEALTAAVGGRAAGRFERWHGRLQQPLCSVKAVAEAAAQSAPDAVSASGQQADTWGSETGVDAAGCLLQLALNKSMLREPALTLLMNPTLLQSVTAASARAEAEENENTPAAAASTPLKALMRAGVRPQMAQLVCQTPEIETGEYEDYESTQSVKEYLVAWAILLAHILAMPATDPGKSFLAQALRAEYELVPDLLNTLLPLIPIKAGSKGAKAKAGPQPQKGQDTRPQQPESQWNLAQELRQGLTHGMSQYKDRSEAEEGLKALSTAVFRGGLHALPASCRAWFGDLKDRSLAAAVEAYTAEKESPLLLQQEFQRVQSAPAAADMDNFSLKANPITREVVAVMEIEDGAVLEMIIKLPASSPLKRAEVSCRRRVGVTEGRLRKWLLSVTAFLANQNGSVAEAMALWQRNVQKEFEGVEECLICYSIVSASDGKLPRLQCKTCSKKFHGSCLYKWFQSSGKSNCPHCQSPW